MPTPRTSNLELFQSFLHINLFYSSFRFIPERGPLYSKSTAFKRGMARIDAMITEISALISDTPAFGRSSAIVASIVKAIMNLFVIKDLVKYKTT